jgi:hypothetical protein
MYLATHRPEPIGPVTVAVPGTPVKLTTWLEAHGMTSGDRFACNKILIRTFGNGVLNPVTAAVNAGNVYIGTSAMNKATMVGVIDTLQPGEFWTITEPEARNVYDLSKYYIDADSANDGVYGNADQV